MALKPHSFQRTVDMGFGRENKVFPYIFNFVSRSDDTWEKDKDTDNLEGVGIDVPANSHRDIAVHIGADYAFRILSIRYTAYRRPPVQDNIYRWYIQPAGFFLEQGDYQSQAGTQLLEYIRVSVFLSNSSRELYGGQDHHGNFGPVSDALAGNTPVYLTALQGYEYGPGQLKTPYLLPASSTLVFRIFNVNDTYDFHVGGAVHGLKVRV